MIESNNPEIDVDELMEKIREEVTRRKSQVPLSMINPPGNTTENPTSSAMMAIISHIEALIRNAESRAYIRTKWPDKLNRFPFNLTKGLQKFALKGLNFLFKDQREVNLNLISALKDSVSLSKQLIVQVEVLRSHLENRLEDVDNSVQRMNQRLSDVDNSIQRVNQRLSDDLDNSIQRVNQRLSDVDHNIHGINQHFSDVEHNIHEINQRLSDDLDHKIHGMNQRLSDDLDNSIQRVNQRLDAHLQKIDKRLDIVDDLLGTNISQNLPNFLEITTPSYINSAIALSTIPIEEHYKYDTQDLYYYLFENVFYNSEIVKEKQKKYLDFIDKNINQSYPFLDAGCGRGEFLQNLKKASFQCIGIDLNKLEIENLQKSRFEVYQSDIINFLKDREQNYCGISAFQVVEHLDIDYIKQFLKLSFDKLVDDGVIMIETINPHSLYALSNFYQDITHIKPLPPEMLQFLLEWHGFKGIKIIYSSPIPKTFRIFKDQKMNYQDYAVIGYKKSCSNPN